MQRIVWEPSVVHTCANHNILNVQSFVRHSEKKSQFYTIKMRLIEKFMDAMNWPFFECRYFVFKREIKKTFYYKNAQEFWRKTHSHTHTHRIHINTVTHRNTHTHVSTHAQRREKDTQTENSKTLTHEIF